MKDIKRIHPKEYTNSYWCPECGKLVNVSYNHPSIPFDIEYDGNIELVSANIDFYIICSDCDSYMLPIDYLISKQIKKLNEMGCKTMYCCAGHLNMAPNLDKSSKDAYKYSIDTSYISFANIPENEYCKFIVKRLLSLREFGFITIEEDDEEIWTIRAQTDIIGGFSDVRQGFINFINSVIINMDKESLDSYTGSKDE